MGRKEDLMEMYSLDRVYKRFKTKGVVFCFSGPISQVMLESIGDVLRRKMKHDLIVFSTIHKVFSVFIEQAQNILSYSAEVVVTKEERTNEIRAGVLMVGHEDGHYYVCCGNYIASENAKRLAEQLAMLQQLDGKELKQLLKKQLREEPSPGSVGAGLGFIEIARRATRPIEFEIRPVEDSELSFFMIKTTI
jgi:hypothetical protein